MPVPVSEARPKKKGPKGAQPTERSHLSVEIPIFYEGNREGPLPFKFQPDARSVCNVMLHLGAPLTCFPIPGQSRYSPGGEACAHGSIEVYRRPAAALATSGTPTSFGGHHIQHIHHC